jgi:hypothetical protein
MEHGIRVRSWCLVCFFALVSRVSAQLKRVDLSQLGYKPPENVSGEYYKQMPAQLISIGQNGELVASFVTRDSFGLATRDLPPLSLHIVRLTKEGKVLSQGLIPTPSWYENAIFFGSNGNYLVRAGDKVILLSPSLEQLAEKQIPVSRNGALVYWHVFPLPNRKSALLYGDLLPDQRASLLSWDDLKPITECNEGPYQSVESVSNRNLLVRYAGRGLNRQIQIREICGAAQLSYSWRGDPLGAVLTSDNTFLLAGTSPVIRFVAGDKVQWSDTFDKKSDMVDRHVEVGADGHLLAIAVKTFAGGNRFLDVGRHLKSIKIVVYEAATGKRLLEIPVIPTPSSMFDFALSPQGNTLAIVSDGILSIVPSE